MLNVVYGYSGTLLAAATPQDDRYARRSRPAVYLAKHPDTGDVEWIAQRSDASAWGQEKSITVTNGLFNDACYERAPEMLERLLSISVGGHEELVSQVAAACVFDVTTPIKVAVDLADWMLSLEHISGLGASSNWNEISVEQTKPVYYYTSSPDFTTTFVGDSSSAAEIKKAFKQYMI